MSIADSVSLPPLKDAASLVRGIAAEAGTDGLEYREIMRRADRRGFAPFLLFAFVLLILPINIVLPQIAAVTMIVCGLGLLFKAPGPWLPGFIAKRKANNLALDKLANFFAAQQGWLGAVVQPRHPEFALGLGERVAALSIVLLGFAVAVPFPDLIPALAVLALALGLFERDGLVMMIGTAAAFGWLAFLITMIAGTITNAPFAAYWASDHAPFLANALAAHQPQP